MTIATPHDNLYWMCQLDRAATVVLVEQDLLSSDDARTVLSGVDALEEDANRTQVRPTDYLDVQRQLTDRVGKTAGHIHIGRSRQDILVTVQRLRLRDCAFVLAQRLLDVRKSLLELAKRSKNALCPSYTNGVQAQPVRAAHLLLGYESSLSRSSQRLYESLSRLNQSPLGGAALATSSYRLNRMALAEYLGFAGIVENAFDAVQLSAIDLCIDIAAVTESLAISLSTLVQDLHAQYHHVYPWFILDDDSLTSPSTLMPQKRNPVALNRARTLASRVVGAAGTARLMAHNVCSGLTDYKRNDAQTAVETGIQLLDEIGAIINGMRIDPDAGIAEIKKDYSTTSELANQLYRKHGIPFLAGHAFASRLVSFGKSHHLYAYQISYDDVCRLYSDVRSESNHDDMPPTFPLSEEELQSAFDPSVIVEGYKGIGGPQQDEIERLYKLQTERLSNAYASLSGAAERCRNGAIALALKTNELKSF